MYFSFLYLIPVVCMQFSVRSFVTEAFRGHFLFYFSMSTSHNLLVEESVLAWINSSWLVWNNIFRNHWKLITGAVVKHFLAHEFFFNIYLNWRRKLQCSLENKIRFLYHSQIQLVFLEKVEHPCVDKSIEIKFLQRKSRHTRMLSISICKAQHPICMTFVA